MHHHLPSSADFTIRPLETPVEIEAYFRLNAETFRPDEDSVLVASRRRRLAMHDPDVYAIQQRGAFLGKTYMGGYRIQERQLCLGPARLRTGCIGGVVTHPDYRHQGIATALMRDALAYAHTHQYALLLLHGIPDFYHQLGFIDVLEDLPRHAINRQLIPQQPTTLYTVREATLADVPALLALYQEHYAASLVSFAPTRTVERQAHYLQNWFQENIQLLALDAEGKPEGYLLLARREHRLYAYEVAANTWPAALALLQRHDQLLNTEAEPPAEIYWPFPLTDSTFYLLADHLPMHSEMDSYPDGGWMACPVSLPTVVQALLPLWQQSHVEWAGVLALTLGEHTCFLECLSGDIHLLEHASVPSQPVILSPHVFTQLVFGFRPVSWAIMQSGQHIPAECVPVLNVLFPGGQAWLPGSDMF